MQFSSTDERQSDRLPNQTVKQEQMKRKHYSGGTGQICNQFVHTPTLTSHIRSFRTPANPQSLLRDFPIGFRARIVSLLLRLYSWQLSHNSSKVDENRNTKTKVFTQRRAGIYQNRFLFFFFRLCNSERISYGAVTRNVHRVLG